MNNFLAAIRFLTIVPLPGKLGSRDADLAGSLPFFPVIGLLIGLAAVGLSQVLWILFNPLLAAVLLVAFLLSVSGGLHMDGLCDTADGFFSSRPRDQVLAIMRDSHIGPMGVMAMFLALLIKIAALASIDPASVWKAALLIPLAGRCSLVLIMAILPYARAEGGLAGLFYSRSASLAAAWSMVFLAVSAWLVAGRAGIVVVGIALGFVLIFTGYCRRKIGGATGDTLGAGCELAETTVALALAAKPVSGLLG